MAQELYELPEKWEWNKLGDVLDVRDGTHDSPKYQQTGYPLVTSKNLTAVGLDLGNVKYISEEDFRFISKRSGVNKGDILFAMIGTIGNPIIIEKQPNFAIKNVALFKPREESQCMEYFCYFLLSPDAIDRMLSSSKGAAQKFVGLGVLRGFDVPLPALNEQKRIVAKLDSLFTRIDTAITHLQQTLELSKALFASALDEVFSLSTTPSEQRGKWKNVKLGTICDLLNGHAFKAKEYVEESGTVIVRMGNIRPNGTFDIEHKIKYLPDRYAKELPNYILNDGDLVIAMTDMASNIKILGIPTLVSNSNGRTLMLNQRVGKLYDFDLEKINSGYLKYVLSANRVRDHYKSLGGGGLQINIGKQQILSVVIPLPSLSEQIQIVDNLNALSERTRTLENITQEKINDLTALKASLLDAAFKGGI